MWGRNPHVQRMCWNHGLNIWPVPSKNLQKHRKFQLCELCATESNEFNLCIGFPESLFIKWVVNITVCKSILVAAPFMRTQALAKVEASIVSSPCSSTSILKNVSAFFMSMPMSELIRKSFTAAIITGFCGLLRTPFLTCLPGHARCNTVPTERINADVPVQYPQWLVRWTIKV